MYFSTALLTGLVASVALARGVPQFSRRANSTGPIGSLDATQSKNAQAIMAETKKEGLPKQACLAAIATALQESSLLVYANNAVPASLSQPHDIVGGDQDSVGLFQQRPDFYPNVAADMDPAQSTAQFFTGMKAVGGWQTMDVSTLCQTIQKAQAGNLYGQRVAEARTICQAGGFP